VLSSLFAAVAVLLLILAILGLAGLLAVPWVACLVGAVVCGLVAAVLRGGVTL
jgi:hypothetical protein